MSLTEAAKPQREFYLDVARVIAVIAISLNHAVNRSYVNYYGQMEEFLTIPLTSTLFKTLCTVFSQLGVPLFLMITGVLILNKRMESMADIKRFYKHNLLGVFITTEIWLVLYYWFIVLFKGENLVLEQRGIGGAIMGMFETMLFQNQVTLGNMWYMPMILCLYTTLPFVVMVKDKLSNSSFSPILFLPAIILFLNNMVRPAVNVLLAMNGLQTYSSEVSEATLFSYFYLYIIAGYLVGKGALSKMRGWLVASLCAVSFLLCFVFQLYAYSQPMDYVVSYNFPLLPICGAFLFELIRRTAHWLTRLERPVTYLSRIAFGIYFMHMVIMTVLLSVTNDMTALNLALKLIILETVSVGGSVVLIALLSKNRLLRKYLFMIK